MSADSAIAGLIRGLLVDAAYLWQARRRICEAGLVAVITVLLVAVGPCLAIGTRPLPSVGVVHDFVWTVDEDIPVLIQAIKDAGCKAVRMPVRWTVVEPRPGKWDFSRTDKVIRTLRNAGIEILGILVSTPAWASGVDPTTERGFGDAYPAKDLGKWAEFVRRCVGRYKNEIGHWEVWQEEDGIDWYRPEPNAVEYAKMLRVSYRAAKKANPSAVVALGSLQMNGIIANPWSSYRNVGFLQKLYDAGIKVYCDAINIHPYVLPTPDQGPSFAAKLVRGTLEVMKANGDGNKPL